MNFPQYLKFNLNILRAYRSRLRQTFSLLVLMVMSMNALANTPLRVAVASNFSATAKQLVEAYTLSGYPPPQLLFGSTGKHAAQIYNGLPVDLLLAADINRSVNIENSGLGVANSRVTYALGELALWVAQETKHEAPITNSGVESLILKRLKASSNVSIANPSLAPYGAASIDILNRLTYLDEAQLKVVVGENVSQVVHFVVSGSVDAAFVPVSMIKALDEGTIIKIPSGFHKPIEQQMILINETPEARRFYDFILSVEGRDIIRRNGYKLPND